MTSSREKFVSFRITICVISIVSMQPVNDFLKWMSCLIAESRKEAPRGVNCYYNRRWCPKESVCVSEYYYYCYYYC